MPDRTVNNAGFLIALATQINDEAFFRALLEQFNRSSSLRFEPAVLRDFAESVNRLLGCAELQAEQNCKSILLLKNTRGLVIKIVNKDGAAVVDSYYSYPSNGPAGEERFAIGKTRFFSSRETIKKLAGCIPGRADKAERRSDMKVIAAVPQVNAVRKETGRMRRSAARLKAAHAAAVIICYLVGLILVQAGCIWYYGAPVFTFMAFFFSGFVGLLLNFIATECIFPLTIPYYRKKLRYGEEGHGGGFFMISYLSNFALFLISVFFVPLTTMKIVEVLLGLIFTFFPMNYLVNILFSMRRYVLKINAGKTPLNARYYSNTALPPFDREDLPSVTISMAVYMEDNHVLFKTMQNALAAVEDYRRRAGAAANLVVSDDGFLRYLNGMINPEIVELYMKRRREKDPTLTEKELVILDRIEFYRENQIAFVARPGQGRQGKFKKGSNLNYTNRLAQALAQGRTREELLAFGGEFYGGYFEGDIAVGDLILVLDKDSGLAPDILYVTVPEFLNDPKLAYTQHKTVSVNSGVNYFTKSMSVFLNTLYNTHLPNKALQGLVVPLMGHNVFVRKSFIEESGGWAEDRVAEDYSKSLDAYRLGYHGKFIAYRGMDFTEYVCQTFAEETDKQYRYCYGLMEMVFKNFRQHLGHYLAHKPYDSPRYNRLKSFHIMDVFTYFLSYANLAGSIPLALFIITGTYINILYGGILINIVIYFLCPVAHSVLFRLMFRDKSTKISPFYHAVISFNYFGHCYSMLKGIITLAADAIKGSYEPFPSSNVDIIEKSFRNGVRTIALYYVKNFPYTVAAVILAVKGVTLLMSGNTSLEVVIPAVYLLSFLFPILLLTPQVFSSPFSGGKAAAARRKERPN